MHSILEVNIYDTQTQVLSLTERERSMTDVAETSTDSYRSKTSEPY